jgi:hypothetical protein
MLSRRSLAFMHVGPYAPVGFITRMAGKFKIKKIRKETQIK